MTNNGRYPSLAERLKNRGRDYTKLLRCPIDHKPVHVEGETLICENGHHSYSREGIIFLLSDEQRDGWDSFFSERTSELREKGWEVPDEGQFKALPTEAIETWDAAYWILREYATAEMWRFLEDLRREREMLPIGDMGMAVEFTGEMGWLGYGLDVSGYATVIVGQDTGPYGLGAYNYGRYPRVQASITTPPLTRSAFDLVLYTYCLDLVDDLEATFKSAGNLLKSDGHLLVFSDSDEQVDVALDTLKKSGFDARKRRVGGKGSKLNKLATTLRGGPGVPPLIIARP
ncbi:MAG: class I SAM-dependent methyltransferase [Chloroflexi bacterium]|nr:class I SAM-dependent methyltransferase [Chloroflexota bacterium]